MQVVFDVFNDNDTFTDYEQVRLIASNSGITPHKYYHLVAVYNRPSAKLLLYVNGSQIGMKSVNYHPKAKTNVAMVIGAYCTTDSMDGQYTRNHFKGVIDEVKIYLGVVDPDNIK